MAVFKPLRQKEKNYVFKVFDNEKSGNPARAVFLRFPFQDELFPVASQKNVLESSLMEEFDNSREAKEKLVQNIIDIMVKNITANRFDHVLFVKECIDRFEDFICDGKEIETVEDFLALPSEAVQKIAKDLYLYSKTEDEFTMGE
jgi:lambda repressor-like predicted transcriptional regulator